MKAITQENTEYYVSISKEELAELPAAPFCGKLQVVDTPEQMQQAVNTLRKSGIIGFDTETRPSFKRGQSYTVSLLQLSTKTHCFLFRINKIGLRPELIDLLEDPTLMKVGLSIHDDFHSLNKLAPVQPQGFVELQQYVKQYRIQDNSLSRIYGILFGQRISKGQRLTNWEASELTSYQQTYAALDAMACIRIYEHVTSGKFNPSLSKYVHSPEPADEEQ